MAHLQFVDTLVKEYLVFRGFPQSLKAFEAELKTDKDKGFRVDKIINHFQHTINTLDLVGLRDMWNHLDNHLFVRLEYRYAKAVKKLENSLLKYYLVTAHSSGKSDKITEFYTKLSAELQAQEEWKEWFYFPFCKVPEEHPDFAVCFTKSWQDTLMVSLHNFLATIFQCMPLPTLARYETDALLIKKLQEENASLLERLHETSNQPSTASAHKSRLSSHEQGKSDSTGATKRPSRPSSNPQNINDIPSLFDVPDPPPLIDDFYDIARDTIRKAAMAESEVRGIRSFIRNMASSGSPGMGRKESTERSAGKRSGSVGSSRS